MKCTLTCNIDRIYVCLKKNLLPEAVNAVSRLKDDVRLIAEDKLERAHVSLVAMLGKHYPINNYSELRGSWWRTFATPNLKSSLKTFFTKAWLDLYTRYMRPNLPNF